MKRSVVGDKSMAFAVRVVNLYKHLRKAKTEPVCGRRFAESPIPPQIWNLWWTDSPVADDGLYLI